METELDAAFTTVWRLEGDTIFRQAEASAQTLHGTVSATNHSNSRISSPTPGNKPSVCNTDDLKQLRVPKNGLRAP